MKDKRYIIPCRALPANCRDCQAIIYFVEDEGEKVIPVNPNGSPHWFTCLARRRAR